MINQISHRHLLWTSLFFYIGCCIFIGATLFFGFGVAAPLFQNIPSRDLAGIVNRVILNKLILTQGIGLSIILIGLLMSLRYFNTFWHQFIHVLYVLTVVLYCIYAFGISPQMNILVQQIYSFDTPKPNDIPLIEMFRTYHKWYSALVSLSIFTSLSTFVWQTFNLTQLVSKPIITK